MRLAAGGAVLAALALSGCGHYADFTLPVLAPAQDRVEWRFEMRPAPVIARGAAGEWDSGDVLNPSVARAGDSWIDLYSGFDGKVWRTGLATSNDGLVWQKHGSILAPDPATWEAGYIAANGSLVISGREWFYWYQAGPKATPHIGLARSNDGTTWQKQAAPVLAPGPRSSWDERAQADPYVIRAGDFFYLYYLGQDRARQQRLGVARSTDGVHWQKLRANPVLELGADGAFDEAGVGEPAVWQSRDTYWMIYTGRDAHEHRRLGMARSQDGVHWSKQIAVFTGTQSWNATVLCDPTVHVSGDTVRVWYGGGDAASPDENLHGQIGYGELHATLAK